MIYVISKLQRRCGFIPLKIIKNLRQQEVEEGPQLSEVVLQRCASQQQLVIGGQNLQLSHQPTVKVFDSVALVHNQVLPLEALERSENNKWFQYTKEEGNMVLCH